MRRFTIVIVLALGAAWPAIAISPDIVGKQGQTLPFADAAAATPSSPLRSDVVFNTAGALDAPATTGGSASGWGSHFIAGWQNDTGADVTLTEFGWPCGGPGPVAWMAWISDELPGPPGSQTFTGEFTPVSDDGETLPPPAYSYIDLADAGIVVPDGATVYFGYENPGVGGQVEFNGTDTWAWYNGGWDPDAGWGRTAVLQLKADFDVVAVEQRSLARIRSLFR